MKGILKESVKHFGFRIGFNLWFRWNFVYPTQDFIWLNITHKPYCTYSGWHCKEENCEHKHLLTKKEILDMREKVKEEIEHVEKGKDGMCVYCGEEKGQVVIPNPNIDKADSWEVCRTCKKIIEQQHKLSMGLILLDKKHGNDIGEKMVKESQKEIKELAYESGKEVVSVSLKKDDN